MRRFEGVAWVMYALAMLLCFGSQSNSMTYHKLNGETLALFAHHQLVAIGEGPHQNQLTQDWLKTLVHEKEFPGYVPNIVVEFGASEYQATIDDFTSGKEVPDQLFKKCWRNTTQLMVWDCPVYEAFFREIRKVNQALPKKRRIRVLLGDASFGVWNHPGALNRDENAVAVVEKQVLAKRQKALIIYGDMHLERRSIFSNYGRELPKDRKNLVMLLEDKGHPVYTVWNGITRDDEAPVIIKREGIQRPALIALDRSELGAIDFASYYPYDVARTDQVGKPIGRAAYKKLPIQQNFDAILYLGSWNADNVIAPTPDSVYDDAHYLDDLIAKASALTIPAWRDHVLNLLLLQRFIRSSLFRTAIQGQSPDACAEAFRKMRQANKDLDWQEAFSSLAHDLLDQKRASESVLLAGLAASTFPDDPAFAELLGDGYLAMGDKKRAVDSYKRALSLSPENKGIQAKLQKLSG